MEVEEENREEVGMEQDDNDKGPQQNDHGGPAEADEDEGQFAWIFKS